MGLISKESVDELVEAYELKTKALEREIELLKLEQTPEHTDQTEEVNTNTSPADIFRNANILNRKGAN